MRDQLYGGSGRRWTGTLAAAAGWVHAEGHLIANLDTPRRTRLLVVEDELLVALNLCGTLEQLGYEVTGPVPNIVKALSLIGMAPPDAALLDENLGGVSVAPVARELSSRHIPFAIVSGHGRSPSSEPLLQQALRAPKPATSAQIAKLLRDLLEQGK